MQRPFPDLYLERVGERLTGRGNDDGPESHLPAGKAVECAGHAHMIAAMLAYSLYTLLAIGLAVLLTAVFRGLRRDDQRIAPPEEDAAFERRIQAIEADYGEPPAGRGD